MGVLVLRYSDRDKGLGRFRVPALPLVAIGGALACLYTMKGLPLHAWERLGIWLTFGFGLVFRVRLSGIPRCVVAHVPKTCHHRRRLSGNACAWETLSSNSSHSKVLVAVGSSPGDKGGQRGGQPEVFYIDMTTKRAS